MDKQEEAVKKDPKVRLNAEERKFTLLVYKTKKEKIQISKEEWDNLATARPRKPSHWT